MGRAARPPPDRSRRWKGSLQERVPFRPCGEGHPVVPAPWGSPFAPRSIPQMERFASRRGSKKGICADPFPLFNLSIFLLRDRKVRSKKGVETPFTTGSEGRPPFAPRSIPQGPVCRPDRARSAVCGPGLQGPQAWAGTIEPRPGKTRLGKTRLGKTRLGQTHDRARSSPDPAVPDRFCRHAPP